MYKKNHTIENIMRIDFNFFLEKITMFTWHFEKDFKLLWFPFNLIPDWLILKRNNSSLKHELFSVEFNGHRYRAESLTTTTM